MKKQLLKFGMATVAVALLSLNAFSQGMTATFNYIDDAPELDGVGDDAVWADAGITVLVPELVHQAEAPSLTDPEIRVFFNDTAFFIHLSAKDDVWYPSWVSGLADWESDKPEIYFENNEALGAAGGPSAAPNGCHQIAPNFSETTQGEWFSQGNQGGSTSFQANTWIEDPCEWEYEYSIPMAGITDGVGDALDPFSRTEILFDVTFIDNDGAGRQRATWSNAGGTDESWNNMVDCGVITLNAEVPDAVQATSYESAAIYPTVTSDIINVPADAVAVAFYNTVGQLIKKVDVTNTVISVADLNKGIHFVTVKNNKGQVSTTKIIVQ